MSIDKARLTPQQVETCELTEVGSMSAEDLALSQGVTRDAIYQRRTRSRLKLRKAGFMLPDARHRRGSQRAASQFIRNRASEGMNLDAA